MGESEARDDFFSLIAKYASQFEGIDYVVLVSSEGFPLAVEGIDYDKAETAAALSIDLATTTSETLRDLTGSPAREILIETGDGKVIDVAKARDLLLLIKGERGVVEAALKPTILSIRGESYKCSYCGYNITLETYQCPKCGRRVPFIVDYCPYCKATINIKKCPKCSNHISSRGEKVVRRKSPNAIQLALLEGIAGGSLLGLLGWIASNSIVAGFTSALVGAGVVGVLTYNAAPSEYKIIKE